MLLVKPFFSLFPLFPFSLFPFFSFSLFPFFSFSLFFFFSLFSEAAYPAESDTDVDDDDANADDPVAAADPNVAAEYADSDAPVDADTGAYVPC